MLGGMFSREERLAFLNETAVHGVVANGRQYPELLGALWRKSKNNFNKNNKSRWMKGFSNAVLVLNEFIRMPSFANRTIEHILNQNLDRWMIAAIHHLQHFGHLLDNWTLELKGKTAVTKCVSDTNANKEGEMSADKKNRDKIYSLE